MKIKKILLKLNSYCEFPKVESRHLNKFTTFDEELGWCTKPNMKKKDKSGTSLNQLNHTSSENDIPFYSTDFTASRTPFVPTDPINQTISCYGDSFCMSREVNDNQTWEYFLGQKLNSLVYNYGVGNYGADQALLRLERDYSKNPSNIVIFAVTSVTCSRIVSVYKHYYEQGNIFAVKPRFVINDEELTLIKSPIINKQDLMNLKKYKSHFRKFDGHYEFWKKNRNPILNKINQEKHKRIDYELSFWQKEQNLFIKILHRLNDFSIKNNVPVIFLLMHHGRFLKDFDKKPWEDVILLSKQKNKAIMHIDSYEWLINYKDKNHLYTKPHLKGHHSSIGNELIAKKLAEYLLRKGLIKKGYIR